MPDQNLDRQRIEWLDVARGIGIFLMVAGHIGYGKIFDHYIHAYHMPLFFFISGYLYNAPSSFEKYIKKKARSLLIPYLSFGILYWVIYCVFVRKSVDFMPVVRFLTFNSNGLAISGAIWYFTAAFFADLIYYTVQEKIKKFYLRTLCVVGIVLIGNFLPAFTGIRLPWSLDAAFVGVGFLFAGGIVRNKIGKMHDGYCCKNILLIMLMLVNTLMIFVNGTVNLKQAEYSNVLLFWINAIVAILILFEISKRLDSHKVFSRSFFLNELKFIGNNTVVYLCVNQAIILCLNTIWDFFGSDNILLLGIYKLVMIVIVLTLLHAVTILFNKSKLKFFIGKLLQQHSL